MARNSHDWIMFEHRAWLESRRVRRMSLAAQGLYVRALALQAIQGNIPADPKELAMELSVEYSEMGVLDECLQHFETEEVNGDTFLYNAKLRTQLEEARAKSEAKSKQMSENGSKGGRPPKNKKQKLSDKKADGFSLSHDSRKAEAFLRAYNSNSNSQYSFLDDIKNSLAAKFQEFLAAYPRQVKLKQSWEAWQREIQTLELADQVIAHVRVRAIADRDWLKDDGKWIPTPDKFLADQLWTDKYKRAKVTAEPEAEQALVVEPPVQLPELTPLTSDRWQEVLYVFRQDDPDVASVWIDPLQPLGTDSQGTVWIVAPSEFSQRWICSNHLDKIADVTGSAVRIVAASQLTQEVQAMKET